jgi:hypothetical protein
MSAEMTGVGVSEKAQRGPIRISWKVAVIKAWQNHAREYALKSVVIASIAGILRMLQGAVLNGFLLWLILAGIMFAIHISEDARLQRKASRFEH